MVVARLVVGLALALTLPTALCAQAVGEICQVDLAAAGDVSRTLQRFQLILHERLGVI